MRRALTLGAAASASDCRDSEIFLNGQCITATDIRGKPCKTASGAEGVGDSRNDCIPTKLPDAGESSSNTALYVGGAAVVPGVLYLATRK